MWEMPKRTKLSDRMAVHLARDIVAERLKAGDALPAESDLADRYGLSKAVARESLQTLASAGLLYVQQGKRTVVLASGEWNTIVPVVQQAFWLEGRAAEFIRGLYEIRRVLETKGVEWAAARGGEDVLDRLDARVRGMDAIARTSKDVLAFLKIDLAFHNTLAVAAHNVILQGLLRNLHTSLLSGWSNPKVAAADLESLTVQHGRIAAAMRGHNVEDAMRAMDDHLRWAEQNTLYWAREAASGVVPASHTESVPLAYQDLVRGGD